MINVMYEKNNPDQLYKDLFNLFSVESEDNDMVTNVHTTDEVGYEGSVHNVTFDYDNDIHVIVHILDNGNIHIEAPEDMITGTESLITGEFPELMDSFE